MRADVNRDIAFAKKTSQCIYCGLGEPIPTVLGVPPPRAANLAVARKNERVKVKQEFPHWRPEA